MQIMATIDHFNLRSFDLNLLVAFDAMMQERNVTRAAARLKVQQPAMSHSLATLRTLFQDDIFVRVGQTMKPTVRALALAAPVRQALAQAQSALLVNNYFDPITHDRTFRLGLTGELEAVIMPDLVDRWRGSAPNIRLQARAIDQGDVRRMLNEGDIDVALGCFPEVDSWHRRETLFEEELACCFNPRLVSVDLPITADQYIEASHVLVSFRDSLSGCLEEGLQRAGVKLNVVASASNFLAVMTMAARSPVLITIPRRVAERYAPLFDLSTGPVPLNLPFPSISMAWHAHSDKEPGLDWLRGELKTINLS